MSTPTLNEALNEIDYVLGRLEQGSELLRSILVDAPDAAEDGLRYLVEAQDLFRVEAVKAMEQVWAAVRAEAGRAQA
ncbi:hypothetical protein BKE38_22430 [Pseudoroseomonas deserti]|uniref:Uncharacterized protein n=1 Tax=Teichococcus deserti TaxID=1817963 RepID=A0A1V2GXG1_9PROT|nr:hypothetical protein [Pseudoroseomonas deserti]ONG47978.1 hypothetical protein BKE38_22430 [Pseudoroseomonas deserti]